MRTIAIALALGLSASADAAVLTCTRVEDGKTLSWKVGKLPDFMLLEIQDQAALSRVALPPGISQADTLALTGSTVIVPVPEHFPENGGILAQYLEHRYGWFIFRNSQSGARTWCGNDHRHELTKEDGRIEVIYDRVNASKPRIHIRVKIYSNRVSCAEIGPIEQFEIYLEKAFDLDDCKLSNS